MIVNIACALLVSVGFFLTVKGLYCIADDRLQRQNNWKSAVRKLGVLVFVLACVGLSALALLPRTMAVGLWIKDFVSPQFIEFLRSVLMVFFHTTSFSVALETLGAYAVMSVALLLMQLVVVGNLAWQLALLYVRTTHRRPLSPKGDKPPSECIFYVPAYLVWQQLRI